MRIVARAPFRTTVYRFAIAATLSVSAAFGAIAPAAANPSQFVAGLWPEAQARGVSRAVFEAAFAGFSPSDRVMELTRSQPEFTQTVGAYLDRRVSAGQVDLGRRMRGEWSQTLARIEANWGVQNEVVLAIWGMETNFGNYMGGNNVIHALATLTYGDYRAGFFKDQLLTALQILQAGHVAPQNMVGSWAGAMGHTQFMPTSFVSYAVDYNGDGRRDIWNSIPDALASTANYLKEHGWRPGETWGYEVRLPANFDYARAWQINRQSLAQWHAMGAVRANGMAFPRPDDQARIFMPSGANGPAFLLLHNFEVIKRYNNSDNYALAVGHLADRILGAGPFVQPWPPNEVALNKAQRRELQTLLNSRGFDAGTADGVVGPRTREAIIAYQRSMGLTADGHASGALLAQLR
ncbi:lytic murein transglycosylase [Pelagibacterium xiamenense]|uniref:lytic murein transglycosylase n=1 Tax=Pelagibacterium xiamenense TaxID=2901140 RepID=UPI001E29DCB7|nr:lytic murein transglycosylase [Pelagibacterium xiamenense]MCD7059462.1 lytic murein transglycosylase [Pelagibacterium xiamenense]